MLPPAIALQRRLARLPSLIGDRRRTRAADRDGAARCVRFGLCDRALYPFLCDRQRYCHVLPAGLHQSGHLAGARLGSNFFADCRMNASRSINPPSIGREITMETELREI